MKKEYMKPEAEKIIFLTEEELMTDLGGSMGGAPQPGFDVEPWSLR